MEHPVWNFEQEPTTEEFDETAINLRAYFDRLPDAKLQQYDPSWNDQELIEWDGNFKGNYSRHCRSSCYSTGQL